MADVYRKVGRGGAGNFYSQKDIESSTTTSDDLEAQKPSDRTPAPADEPPSDPAFEQDQHFAPQATTEYLSSTSAAAAATTPTVYARTGRGGAGNFVDPASAVHQHPQQQQSPPLGSQPQSLAPARPATVQSKGNRSFGGRGGAGNWAGSAGDSQPVVDEEQERKRREALDAKVFNDVMAGLQEPGRAHTHVHVHGRGAGVSRGGPEV
ncbi:hypothetical protein BX600DRAFT_508871 [Xylariales sp. PMI_506]|nr:hypothetical protein BX600DRAFT_508871 [Xylariales sp. PMI_506]